MAEKTICRNDKLATLDAEIAAAYRKLRAELDPGTTAALASDQRWFVGTRDAIATMPKDSFPVSLADELKGRRKLLRVIDAHPAEGFAGYWHNLAGGIDIVATGEGRFKVEGNAAEPTNGRWVCNFEGLGKVSEGALDVKETEDSGNDSRGSGLRLTRVGASLKVVFVPSSGSGSSMPGYCGLNGSLDGDYFAVPRGYDGAN